MKSTKVRAKSKKSNGRVRFTGKDGMGPMDSDLSKLRPPIDTSITTLLHISQLLENGSEEVRSILSYECDLLYECRVCRSLFRSLANLISHKRVYCLTKFNIAFCRNTSNDFDTNLVFESLDQRPEKVQGNSSNNRILRSQVPREQRKRDLTSVIGMLQKKRIKTSPESQQVFLEDIRTNPCAVYQTMDLDLDSASVDLMNAQVMEVEGLLKKDTLVLGADGRCVQSFEIEKNGGIQVSGSEEENETSTDTSLESIVCSICNAKFATRKTLMAHTKSLHTSHRMSYPCPCCSSTFTSTWSVYRHLFKVHKKSNDQVRKLRSQIQEKAFCSDSTMAESLELERLTKPVEDNQLVMDSTQEWINQLESDSDLQRCGGCGKRFDRKAALSAHLQYCQRRLAVYNKSAKSKQANKLLEPFNAMEPTTLNASNTLQKRTVEADSVSSESNEMSIRVEAVASLSKEDWDKLDSEYLVESGRSNVVTSTVNVTNRVRSEDEAQQGSNCEALKVPEAISTNVYKCEGAEIIRGSRKRKMKLKRYIKRFILDTEERDAPEVLEMSPKGETTIKPIKLDHAQLMERKVASIANLQKLQCLPCKQKFTSLTNLRRHVAIHIGWHRYRCKLCEYKCFVKCDCVAHCNKQHNAQNNRSVIAEMMEQIPEKDYNVEPVKGESLVELPQVSPQKRNDEMSGEIVAQSEVKSKVQSKVVQEDGQRESEIQVKISKGLYIMVKQEPEAELRDIQNDVEELFAKVEPERTIQECVTCKEIHEESLQSKESKDPKENQRVQKVEKNYVQNKEETENEIGNQEEPQEISEESNGEEDIVEVENVPQGNQRVSKLDADPALRRMVMEVIFGSEDPFPSTESEKELTNDKNHVMGTKNNISKKFNSNCDIIETKISSEDVNEMQDGSKPQRPIRNRIKPINKDFVYDLKEAVTFRKDIGIRSESFGKLRKKRMLGECNSEDDEEGEGLKGFEGLILPYDNHDDDDLIENVDVIVGDSLANNLALSQCSTIVGCVSLDDN